jgi:hypothetical protein
VSKAIVRSGLDAFVLSAYPYSNYASATRLRVKSGEAEGFVFFKSPVPKNSTVTSAKLRLWNGTAQTGSVTVSAQRVAASWKVRRLTWNNKPGVVGSAASATLTSPAVGDYFEIDLTSQFQTIANGAANYGLKITTSFTTLLRLFSLNAAVNKPVLVVEWTDQPDTPTMLRPYGGLAVSTDKPILRFSYSDPGGDDALDAVQVQIDAGNNFVSGIDFDSGWVTATDPELDLSTTAYAGLADGSTTYWRVRVRDEAGGISDWSDVASFKRDDKGTLILTNPAASPNNFVDEFTPPIAWTFTGETQKSYQVRIARSTHPNTWIYDSGRVVSTSTTHTLPFRWHGHRVLRDDLSYIVNLRVWDTKDRVQTPTVPVYQLASRSFSVQYDNTLTPITSFTASQPTEAPWVRLQWDRATMPDQWVIVRDGEIIDKFDTGADLFVSGTTYRYTDYTARPFVAHTYKVRAVDIVTGNRKMAATSPTSTITPTCPGFWLIDPDRPSLEVNIGGSDTTQIEYGEDSALFTPIGADSPTRIVSSLRGLEGLINGPIEDTAVHTWDVHKANLLALKATPSQTYRLAFGDENIPVTISHVKAVVSPDALPTLNHMRLQGSFVFEQNGDLPFDAEL